MEMMKKCTQCGEEKEVAGFHTPSRRVCKVCVNENKKQQQREYDQIATTITKVCTMCCQKKNGKCFRFDSKKCRECILQKQNRVLNKPTEDMPDKCCKRCQIVKVATKFRYRTNVCIDCEKNDLYKWRHDNPERFKEHLQKYRSTDEYLAKRRTYLMQQYHNNMQARIAQMCRNRIRGAIYGIGKSATTQELLGCSIELLQEWLEYNFDENMKWENIGTYWHIDHIKPCASFDLTNVEEQRQCFHWTNLAPLEKHRNMSKGDKIIEDVVIHYKAKVEQFEKEYLNA